MGDEDHLVDCSHGPWGEHDCDTREAAGAFCAPKSMARSTTTTTTTTTTTSTPNRRRQHRPRNRQRNHHIIEINRQNGNRSQPVAQTAEQMAEVLGPEEHETAQEYLIHNIDHGRQHTEPETHEDTEPGVVHQAGIRDIEPAPQTAPEVHQAVEEQDLIDKAQQLMSDSIHVNHPQHNPPVSGTPPTIALL